jgi:hypothetical protein
MCRQRRGGVNRSIYLPLPPPWAAAAKARSSRTPAAGCAVWHQNGRCDRLLDPDGEVSTATGQRCELTGDVLAAAEAQGLYACPMGALRRLRRSRANPNPTTPTASKERLDGSGTGGPGGLSTRKKAAPNAGKNGLTIGSIIRLWDPGVKIKEPWL